MILRIRKFGDGKGLLFVPCDQSGGVERPDPVFIRSEVQAGEELQCDSGSKFIDRTVHINTVSDDPDIVRCRRPGQSGSILPDFDVRGAVQDRCGNIADRECDLCAPAFQSGRIVRADLTGINPDIHVRKHQRRVCCLVFGVSDSDFVTGNAHVVGCGFPGKRHPVSVYDGNRRAGEDRRGVDMEVIRNDIRLFPVQDRDFSVRIADGNVRDAIAVYIGDERTAAEAVAGGDFRFRERTVAVIQERMQIASGIAAYNIRRAVLIQIGHRGRRPAVFDLDRQGLRRGKCPVSIVDVQIDLSVHGAGNDVRNPVSIPVHEIEHGTVADVDFRPVRQESGAGREHAVVVDRIADLAVACAVNQIGCAVAVDIGESRRDAQAILRVDRPVAGSALKIHGPVELRRCRRSGVVQDSDLSCRIRRFLADDQIKFAVTVEIVPDRNRIRGDSRPGRFAQDGFFGRPVGILFRGGTSGQFDSLRTLQQMRVKDQATASFEPQRRGAVPDQGIRFGDVLEILTGEQDVANHMVVAIDIRNAHGMGDRAGFDEVRTIHGIGESDAERREAVHNLRRIKRGGNHGRRFGMVNGPVDRLRTAAHQAGGSLHQLIQVKQERVDAVGGSVDSCDGIRQFVLLNQGRAVQRDIRSVNAQFEIRNRKTADRFGKFERDLFRRSIQFLGKDLLEFGGDRQRIDKHRQSCLRSIARTVGQFRHEDGMPCLDVYRRLKSGSIRRQFAKKREFLRS